MLVDILYRPENLFPANTEARIRCENGGFIAKLINHTERFVCIANDIRRVMLMFRVIRLLDEKEDRLCVRILETLKEMMALDPAFEAKVLLLLRNADGCILEHTARTIMAFRILPVSSFPICCQTLSPRIFSGSRVLL